MTPETLFLVLVTLVSIEAAIIMIVFAWTPAGVFLRCRLGNSTFPLGIIGRSNRLTFVAAKHYAGTFHTKKNGIYQETPGSFYTIKKVPTFFAYEDYAATMPLKYPKIVQLLRKLWPGKINNFGDLKEQMEKPENAEKAIELNEKKPETILIGDLQHMFPANDNPYTREAEKDAEITIQNKSKKADLVKWLLIVGGIVIIAYIAWKLFQNGNTAPIEVVCKNPQTIINAADVATGSNLTL